MPDGLHQLLGMIDERFGRGIGTAVLGIVLAGIVAFCLQPIIAIVTSVSNWLAKAIPALTAGHPIITIELWAQFIVVTAGATFVCTVFYFITEWMLRRSSKLTEASHKKIDESIAATEKIQKELSAELKSEVRRLTILARSVGRDKRKVEKLFLERHR